MTDDNCPPHVWMKIRDAGRLARLGCHNCTATYVQIEGDGSGNSFAPFGLAGETVMMRDGNTGAITVFAPE